MAGGAEEVGAGVGEDGEVEDGGGGVFGRAGVEIAGVDSAGEQGGKGGGEGERGRAGRSVAEEREAMF